MIYDAMQSIDALGVSVCEAHPDLEVFRLRLGKALNYEFNEDTQTGLFQRRDPREGTLHLYTFFSCSLLLTTPTKSRTRSRHRTRYHHINSTQTTQSITHSLPNFLKNSTQQTRKSRTPSFNQTRSTARARVQ